MTVVELMCVTSEIRPKRHYDFVLGLGSLTLEEVCCHVMKTIKQPFGEIHEARNYGLLPTTREVRHLESESANPSHQMMAALADILIAIHDRT